MKATIKVTKEHIARGRGGSMQENPVFLAICARWPNCYGYPHIYPNGGVYVDDKEINPGTTYTALGREHSIAAYFMLPPAALKAYDDAFKGKKISPFKFEVEIK